MFDTDNDISGRQRAKTITLPEDAFAPRTAHRAAHRSVRRSLRVAKFGGTSVGNAACIRRVVDIVHDSSRDSDIVVVVSAMAGVTNKLLEVASQAEAGNIVESVLILQALREQHEVAINDLIPAGEKRNELYQKMRELLEQCEDWCKGAATLGQLTAAARDSISSIGERLTAPIVAAALTSRGLLSEPVEATDIIVTDGFHGAADPQMELTTPRCELHVASLVRRGIIPVVTGFIGSTQEGALTTLGRGGSDYSATILGAALNASEVIIWTDVDGMLTADPKLVPDASTIPEISYREASELAYFGAKVLHPKTLRPVMQQGIPVWIRNTFAPENKGTKITPTGSLINRGVKAITAISDAALITVGVPALQNQDLLGRTLATAKAIRVDVLMASRSEGHIFLVVAAAYAQVTVEALHREFASDLTQHSGEGVHVDAGIAILTVVGEDLHAAKSIVGRATDKLSGDNVNVLATGQGSSECHYSFVVAKHDVHAALLRTHREFEPVLPHGSPQEMSRQRHNFPTVTTTPADEQLRPRPNSSVRATAGASKHETEILDENSFRTMIAHERKRTERSRNPVLLMLLDIGTELPFERNGRLLNDVLSVLSASTRETDVIGWYKDNSTIGVMFTEIPVEDPGAILGTMMYRVSKTLRHELDFKKFSQIRISWHLYPENWDQDTSPANPTLYPDLEHREKLHRGPLAIKRLIDVVASLAALFFLSPVFLIVAILVKSGSKGPMLFKQERLGQFGKPFTFLKFRSMYTGNDLSIHQQFMKKVIKGNYEGKTEQGGGKVYKMTDDPRVTPIGRFIRRTSLDELPQFINVLKGEMSLVGPRPPIAYECQEYEIWHRRRVLEVKPGITGLWQIKGRSRVRFDDMVRLDLQYVRTWSLWLDLQILLKTPAAVLWSNDAF